MGTLRKYSDLSLEVEQTWLDQLKVERALQFTEGTLETLGNQPAPCFDDSIGSVTYQDLMDQVGGIAEVGRRWFGSSWKWMSIYCLTATTC